VFRQILVVGVVVMPGWGRKAREKDGVDGLEGQVVDVCVIE
jgi:hypothetical protein